MERSLPRRTVLKGVGAAGAIGMAGCLGGGGDADVMVGVLQPTTGDLGDLGTAIRDAAILPGVQFEESDFTVDLRDEDTESTADTGVTRAQALRDAGYPCITGAASSATTIDVANEVLIPDEIVGISPASTAPEITTMEDNDFLFRTCPSDALQGEVMAQVGYEERGLETASTFYLNNQYGQQLSDSFVSAFEDLGGTVSAEVAFEGEQPSYSSALQSALDEEPDLMIVIGYPASGEQIFRDYYADYEGDETIMVTDGLRSSSLPGDVDNPLDNVIGTAPLAAGPNQEAFSSLYQDEYDDSPGVFTAQAYDATSVLILASVAADELAGPAVRDNVRAVANPGGEAVGPDNVVEGAQMVADGTEVQYQGASSPVVFDDNGDMEAVTYEIFEFGDGEIETVDTVEFGA